MLTRVMCTLLGASGLSEDRFVNTFYFASGVPLTDADRDDLADALHDFYDTDVTVGATPRSLSDFLNMAGIIPTDGLEIKMYTMADATPRIPTHVSTHDLTAGSSPPLPHEVAVCMSYRGTPVSGVPIGRRRGRIYLGPLNTTALATGVANGAARPTGNLTAMVPLLAQRLKTAATAVGAIWGVHSPTTGLEAYQPITQVGCDDAFDTQRRRGIAPTTNAYVTLA